MPVEKHNIRIPKEGIKSLMEQGVKPQQIALICNIKAGNVGDTREFIRILSERPEILGIDPDDSFHGNWLEKNA